MPITTRKEGTGAAPAPDPSGAPGPFQPGCHAGPGPTAPGADPPGIGTGLEVRTIASRLEYDECEELQDLVWGPEDFVKVPALVLITAQRNGGHVLGAFAGDGRLAGFVCSFPGLTTDGKVKQCSQLLAVHPEFQNCGVGYRLKLAQRKATLNQGLDLITWTFDPLVSLNAHFNISKLGCISKLFLEDCYGTPAGGLNGGLATDRLVAQWWLQRSRVIGRVAGRPRPEPPPAGCINTVEPDPRSGLPRNSRLDLDRDEPDLELEIPGDLATIKRCDFELARRWRGELRQMLGRYLARRYCVSGFSRRQDAGRLRSFYRLSREAGE